MSGTWTVKDSSGAMISRFSGGSLREVGRKILPTRYDAFRIEVSTSYRELFERELKAVLKREGWRIVPMKRRRSPTLKLNDALNFSNA